MDFEILLKKKGLKITPQRIAILQEIHNIGHATIEEIYDNIRKIYPSISLATVYKNISAMCEFGIINEIKPPLQKQLYEINCNQHSHLVCQKCGKLQDISLDIHDILRSVHITEKFQISSAITILYGICEKCQVKK